MPGKDEEIKIRVPSAMKRAIKRVADVRFTSESEIAREALLEYLRARDISLRDEPVPAPPGTPPKSPVTYTKPKRKPKANSKVAAAEKEIGDAIVEEAENQKPGHPKPEK